MAQCVPLLLLVVSLCLFQPAASNQPPTFKDLSTVIWVAEDKEAGSIVGTLKAEDVDDDEVEFSIEGEIANTILELQKVGPKEANILLKKMLDRETAAKYLIIFSVEDGARNKIQKFVDVYVQDTNDNAPSFEKLPYKAEIPEDAVKGTFVFTVTANDPDGGTGGVVTYSIKTPQNLFAINGATGNVTLQGSLDYETGSFYRLEISAEDGFGLSMGTDLIVEVKDVQDTAPFFMNLPYLATVLENATVGTEVIQVSALDGDRGVSNPVRYSFSVEDNHGYFSIDPDSGKILVAQQMDREEAWVLEKFGVLDMTVMTTEVTDNPKGPVTATAPVSIRIRDVNDQVPTFGQAEYQAKVQENSQVRIPITILPDGTDITVTDWDAGDNGRFELSVESMDGGKFDVFDVTPQFVLNEAIILIRVKNSSALDYETVKSYSFNVVAAETKTTEKFRGTAKVTVQLEDVNDNWPEFEEEDYTAEIKENSPNGTSVITIQATDKDEGLWGELTYLIRGASAHLFQVDAKTGLISVGVAADQDLTLLDRESRDVHTLTLEARDGGGLRASRPIRITLLDVNDNAPVPVRDVYEGFIDENKAEMERKLIIEATDRDLPPNSNVFFTILDGDPNGNFSLDRNSGELRVSAPLDYEAMDPALNGKYALTVQVEDGGDPTLKATVMVYVEVKDQNDNAPFFNTSDPSIYKTTISENQPFTTAITTLVANDNDKTSPNNKITYRIESGARDKFRIDSESGAIFVETGANLDWNVYGTKYSLKVVAVDGGSPAMSGSVTMEIQISDVNNKNPVFNPDRRFTQLKENTTAETRFFTYTATDQDEDADLRYSLMQNQVIGEDEMKRPVQDKEYLMSLFDIDPVTGEIYVTGSLNRETVEEITITVFVEDLNAVIPPQQNSTGLLFITLLDINDNPPMFQPSDVYTARISEASKAGIEVKAVLAIDSDKNSGAIAYSMVYDPTNSWTQSFEITEANKYTGVVTLRSPVDHEETEWINVTVQATDSGTPPLASTASLNVQIEDVNDNSPVWQNFPAEVWVWENATVATIVQTVLATDRDSGEFGEILYFLDDGDQGYFSIESTTGIIETTSQLDRETIADYRLIVSARDSPSAPPSQQRRSPANMHVRLRDVNDNAPIFDQALYVAEIRENDKPAGVGGLSSAGASVTVVRATDLDTGLNAQLTYSINDAVNNATGLFGVEADTGRVYVARSLSGKAGEYFIVIMATDGGEPSLSNSTMVHIQVEDVNDHPPVITHPPENFTVEIKENLPADSFVTYVSATDKDDGINGVVEFQFVENIAGPQDFKKFHIDSKSGNITTAEPIDREEQAIYLLEVRAYDLGKPSYDARTVLTVRVLDENDNEPSFSRTLYPPPYILYVQEEQSPIVKRATTAGGVVVGNVAFAEDKDTGVNSQICYYLVGGDKPYKDQFHVEKTTGQLTLTTSLDREKVQSIQLVLKATADCVSGKWEQPANTDQSWDITDLTLMLIEIQITDINDNPPRFTKRWFTAGVTQDTQFGEEVINFMDYSYDADAGNNSILTYWLIPESFNYSSPLGSQLQQRGEKEPFVLNPRSGLLTTNIYFQQNMQGYIQFRVGVNDSMPGHKDVANVSIYLLNEEQRVKIVLRGTPDEVGEFKDIFANFLSNITGVIINVDKIRTHMDFAGKPDLSRTDMFLHGIYPSNGEILEADVLIGLIDKNYLHLTELFKQYNVITVEQAVAAASTGISSDITLALILVACILACILIIVCVTFFLCRKKYKRKLKAATAIAFGNNGHTTIPNGSRDSGLNRLEMPGTNMHTYEGSNPIWMEQYNNQPVWPADSSDTESMRHRPEHSKL